MTPTGALEDRLLPRNEVLLLLTHASGRSRTALLASPDAELTDAQATRYRELRDRRVAGEPIAYLVGFREFYGRSFMVGPDVLIPRPETELLVDLVVARHPAPRTILDLGTGSGVIAITLALDVPGAQVSATDVSRDALAIARINARSLDAQVEWLAGDWYDAVARPPRRFDVIVSNPPYIAARDRHLAEGDLRFEPTGALSDGGDGLSALRDIVAGAPAHLQAGGTLLVEHGYDQADPVHAMFVAAGLTGIASQRDLAGHPRAMVGRRD